ncbi:hypothetical protein ABFS83_06G008100 [Erythranthe nasuta]
MVLNSFSNLAFLTFFSVLVISLHLPHRALSSSRGGFLLEDKVARPPAAGMCAAAAATLHGYKCQEFQVTTDDGYILSVQRIPEGRTRVRRGHKRPPVLLQHGILVDGMTWMLNTPQQSLATVLADNGFDVWISNTRGTRFSRRHLTLDPTDPEYWNWTWDELVTHELPSIIGFVFKQTGHKIHYVGHSMGTLIALASLSNRKLHKVKSAALLSPVAYLTHMKTDLGIVAANIFVGEILTTMFGMAEFNPKGDAVAMFLNALCAGSGLNCYDMLTVLTGKNCCLNASTVHTTLKNEPQPTATKNLVHFAQTFRYGVLSKFDYGNANFEHYGESTPPVYNLSNIRRDFPLFLSYGGQDALSDVQDVATLLKILKSHKKDKLQVQYIKHYAHVDFVLGTTAKDIVYNQIIAFFRRHNK